MITTRRCRRGRGPEPLASVQGVPAATTTPHSSATPCWRPAAMACPSTGSGALRATAAAASL
eukprot:8372523-Pyramimonas_sp.AAC.1